VGVVGVILLYGMWLYHLLLFRGDGLGAWIGLLVWCRIFLPSLFNSHCRFSRGLDVRAGRRRCRRNSAPARSGAPPCRKARPAMSAGMRGRDRLSAASRGMAPICCPVGGIMGFKNLRCAMRDCGAMTRCDGRRAVRQLYLRFEAICSGIASAFLRILPYFVVFQLSGLTPSVTTTNGALFRCPMR